MANTTGYMGFKHFGFLPGTIASYELKATPINSTTTAIYRGDPVVFSSGVLVAATTTTSAVDGIFDGCTYTDSTGLTKWSPYCPASQTATGYVLIAPGSLFQVFSNGTAVSRSNVNKNVSFVVNAGQTTGGGFSGYQIDAGNITTTSTLPFRIYGLLSDYAPSGVNGTDNSSNNNIAIVTFNSTDFKAGTTGV